MLCKEAISLLFGLKIRSPISCDIRNNSQLRALNKEGVQMQGRYLENFYNSYDQSMLDSLDKQESEWRGKEVGFGFACPKWSEFTCFGRISPSSNPSFCSQSCWTALQMDAQLQGMQLLVHNCLVLPWNVGGTALRPCRLAFDCSTKLYNLYVQLIYEYYDCNWLYTIISFTRL